jgi:hypothetical protein
VAGLQTEFSFTLPKGYVDEVGVLHRHGVMRLATARDEIEPLRSTAIDGPDDPYLTVLVLARVVTELGSLPSVSSDTIVNLFAADLAFLQDLYGIINFGDPADVAALQATVAMPVEPDQIYDASTDFAVAVESNDSDQVPHLDDGGEQPATGRTPPTGSRARIEEVQRASAP